MCRSVPPLPNWNTLHSSEAYVRADASGAVRFPHEFERCGAVLARWPVAGCVGQGRGADGPRM